MYPRECAQPMGEDQLLTGKPEITSLPYAIAKLAGVHACLARNAQSGASRFVPVIPNSIYGPNDNFDPTSGHVLSSLMARFHAAKEQGVDAVTLWGTGSPCREFVHVSDVADACVFLLGHEVPGELLPLNIGVGSDVSIRELALLIARIVGFEGEVRWDHSKPDGAPRKLLDVRRMSALGWNAKVALETGLRDLYEWYRTQRGPAT
jgi:GDP-L-fucose synthase